MVALKEIRLQPEEGTPFTAIREGTHRIVDSSMGRILCYHLRMLVLSYVGGSLYVMACDLTFRLSEISSSKPD